MIEMPEWIEAAVLAIFIAGMALGIIRLHAKLDLVIRRQEAVLKAVHPDLDLD